MSIDESFIGSQPEVNEQRVLEVIESSYPNPISLADIAKYCNLICISFTILILIAEKISLGSSVESNQCEVYFMLDRFIQE